MKKHLPALSFIAAAMVCYAVGSSFGGSVFVLLGGVFELAAWHKVLHPNK